MSPHKDMLQNSIDSTHFTNNGIRITASGFAGRVVREAETIVTATKLQPSC
jgi:hypothetical protein